MHQGSHSIRRAVLPILLVLLAGGVPSAASGQALKLESLQFPTTSRVGPWVSYRVRTQFRVQAPREYTQRVAIVAKDAFRGKNGFWVELKTEGLPSGTRIERGFFAIVDPGGDGQAAGEAGDAPSDSLTAAPQPSVRLMRYLVLTSGGKLYEYPVSTAAEPRAGGEVSMVELFEYDPATPAQRESLGPDTLQIGRRVIPALVERIRMNGASTWPAPGSKSHANRPVLTQTFWRNPAVPVTGFARSVFEVTMQRERIAAGDSAASDSALARPGGAPADSAGAAPQVVTRTELTLLDLGADAIPEVTQTPEEGEPPSDAPTGPVR